MSYVDEYRAMWGPDNRPMIPVIGHDRTQLASGSVRLPDGVYYASQVTFNRDMWQALVYPRPVA